MSHFKNILYGTAVCGAGCVQMNLEFCKEYARVMHVHVDAHGCDMGSQCVHVLLTPGLL